MIRVIAYSTMGLGGFRSYIDSDYDKKNTMSYLLDNDLPAILEKLGFNEVSIISWKADYADDTIPNFINGFETRVLVIETWLEDDERVDILIVKE